MTDDLSCAPTPATGKLKDVPIGSITNGIHLLGWMKGTVRRYWRRKLSERLEMCLNMSEATR